MATTFASLGLGGLSEAEKRVVLRELAGEIDDFVPGGFATREELHAELRRRVARADAYPGASRDFNVIEAEVIAELASIEQGS